MIKKLKLLFLFIVLSVFITSANAMTFEEAYKEASRTPMVMLVYAQWAEDYDNYLNQFKVVQEEFGKTFNFVEMDIASEDTRAFNAKYHIYPNLPYILMFRDGGKVSRYIPRDCAASSSCISSKLKTFIQ